MSRIGGLDRTRLPDFSIGATVLMVAIALPFFVFTRMEHAHRTAPRPVAVAPSASVQGATATPDPAATADPTAPVVAGPPQAPSKATPSARPAAKVPVRQPGVATTPISPTSAPTGTPSPPPDFAPVGVLSVSPGSAPLSVTADASGSSDTDHTPIAQVFFNFGDGSPITVQAGLIATHLYTSPGSYTVSVAVIDTAHLSTTVSSPVTVY